MESCVYGFIAQPCGREKVWIWAVSVNAMQDLVDVGAEEGKTSVKCESRKDALVKF